MTGKEYLYFKEEIGKIKDGLPHPIADFEITDIQWKKMRSGNIASYNHILGVLSLNGEHRNMPEMLISTLAHELHHKWQHQHYGVLYYFMAIAFLRNICLEKTAIEVENAADELLGMSGMRSGDKGSGMF